MTDWQTRMMQEAYAKLEDERKKDPVYNLLSNAEGNGRINRHDEFYDDSAYDAIMNSLTSLRERRMSPTRYASLLEVAHQYGDIQTKRAQIKRICER